MKGTIDGSEVYLTEGQEPAFSLSIDSLTDPSKVTGIRSTTIKVLRTKEAARIYGTEHMDAQVETDAKVLQIGAEGAGQLTTDVLLVRYNREELELRALGGNASWFKFMRDTLISDLDLGVSPLVTSDYQRSTWTDEDSTLYFALADFGSFEGQSSSHNVGVVKVRPALRAHKVLEQAFKEAGFKLRPMGTLVDEWKSFVHLSPDAKIHSLSNEENPDTAIVRIALTGVFVLATTPVLSEPGWINTVETWDPNDNFNGGAIPSAERYLAPFDTRLSVEIRDLILSDIPPELDGTRLRVVLYEKGQDIPLSIQYTEALTTGGTHTINLLFPDVFIEESWQVNVGFWNETGAPANVTVSGSSARILFVPKTRPYAPDCALDIATCAGEMTVSDLLTALTRSQFLVFETDQYSKVVRVWYEVEFFRTPNTLQPFRDWSDRLDHTNPPTRVLPDLPSRIQYRWKEERNDVSLKRQGGLLKAPGYGNADVVLGGISAVQKVEMPYAPTAMGFVLGGLRIPIIRSKDEGEDNYEQADRLLYADGLRSGTWTHDGDTLTEYPSAYFVREAGTHPIAFGNAVIYGDEATEQTVGTLGRSRLDRMKRSQVLEGIFFVRDHEVEGFDHGLPTLVDDGSGKAWYWVQEIKQHRLGAGKSLTKCVLVQIPAKEVAIAQVSQPAITYPAQPFLCAGFGYVPVTVSSGTASMGFSASGGYFSVRFPDGTIETFASNTQVDGLEVGGYCVWPSDSSGQFGGQFTYSACGLGDVTFDLAGIEGMGPYEEIYILDSTATELDIPLVTGLPALNMDSTPMETITVDASQHFSIISITGAALSEASVVALITAAYNTALASLPIVSVYLAGGTSAAPPSSVDHMIAYLTGGENVTISGTGNTDVDGEYVANGTINGRPAFIHAVNGITELFWASTQWRILAVGAILDSYDNVPNPWETTTWILVVGTASSPTITGPGYGIPVTTN